MTYLLTSHEDHYQNVVIYLLKQKKERKIVNLTKRRRKPCNTNCFVRIINLSNYNLSNQENQNLKLGLNYYFIDKNKDFQRFLAANIESLAYNIKNYKNCCNLRTFYIETFIIMSVTKI